MKTEWEQYLNQPIGVLKRIQPKWAYGRNYRKARYTSDFLKAGCTIYNARLDEVIQRLEFGEVRTDRLFTGENRNDSRVANILFRWDNDQFVDPPNIFVQNGGKSILFGDGRHRTKTAYFLGQEQIPLIISDEDFLLIKEVLQLSR
ncbi:hypothetical protein D3C87_362950 [compost metagenome]